MTPTYVCLIIPLILGVCFLTKAVGATRHLSFALERRPNTGRNHRRRLFHDSATMRQENDGVYWATLRIGSPVQQVFSAIVDTGSATIAVPCQGCSCGSHNHFNSGSSHTADATTRSYSQCYSEGSCNRGKYISDLMCLGESCPVSEAVRHEFGCCSKFASAFKEQEADGIVGFGGKSGSLIHKLRDANMLDSNMFAICLGVTGGSLAVGGYLDYNVNVEPIQWVSSSEVRSSYYHLLIESADIGGSHVVLGKSALVDSGTSFTYIPSSVHAAMKSSFASWCAVSPARCRGTKNPREALSADIRDSVACYKPPSGTDHRDTEWLATFPPIEFKVSSSNAFLCVPAEQYFFVSKQNALCVGMFKDHSFVIGANVMAQFNFIFDADKSEIGFARASCDSDGAPLCCGECEKRRTDVAQPPFKWCTEDWEPASCPLTRDGCDRSIIQRRDTPLCLGSNGVETPDENCNALARPATNQTCATSSQCNESLSATWASSNATRPSPTRTAAAAENTTTIAMSAKENKRCAPKTRPLTKPLRPFNGDATQNSGVHSASFIVAVALISMVVIGGAITIAIGRKSGKAQVKQRPKAIWQPVGQNDARIAQQIPLPLAGPAVIPFDIVSIQSDLGPERDHEPIENAAL